MEDRYTFTQSACYKRAVAALKAEPRDRHALSREAHIGIDHAYRILQHLHKIEKAIRICRWDRSSAGPHFPVFAWGKGQDAPKPSPKSDAEKCRAYRKRLRAKYGEKTKHIIRAQRKPIPGLRIVLAGKVVYQQ